MGIIDLRSDTLTKPSEDMLKYAFSAPVGDAGRIDKYGQGEDPSVNELEKYAEIITGKESALFRL